MFNKSTNQVAPSESIRSTELDRTTGSESKKVCSLPCALLLPYPNWLADLSCYRFGVPCALSLWYGMVRDSTVYIRDIRKH